MVVALRQQAKQAAKKQKLPGIDEPGNEAQPGAMDSSEPHPEPQPTAEGQSSAQSKQAI